MFFGKIVVKENYEKRGDLVFRPLIRAYNALGLDSFFENEDAILLGIIEDNNFYELFTWKKIEYSNFEIIDSSRFEEIMSNMPLEKARLLKKTINNLVFNKHEEKEMTSSSIEELAHDRAIEFQAYDKALTDINPYKEPLNGYNDFAYKCKVLEKRKTA